MLTLKKELHRDLIVRDRNHPSILMWEDGNGGPGVYRSSYNFWATPGKPLGYHPTGDPELQAEGGMIKVAVRSTFQPGEITVSANSPGLGSRRAKFMTIVNLPGSRSYGGQFLARNQG